MAHLCFTIEGAFITDLSRQLWGAERKPQKGFNLLKSAFPDMDPATMIAIMMGYKKLTGDSNTGVLVEDDDQAGPDLSLDQIVEWYELKFESLQDHLQFALGETKFVSSPHGLIEVPERRVTTTGVAGQRICLDGGPDLLKRIPWRKVTDRERREKFFHPRTKLASETLLGIFSEEEEYIPFEEETIPEYPPPVVQNKITRENGWLSLDGKFYPCEYGEHIELAHRIGKDSITLERLGWVKLQKGQAYNHDFDMKRISQKQRDVLFDYHRVRGNMPWWMDIED